MAGLCGLLLGGLAVAAQGAETPSPDGARDFDFLEKVLHKLLMNFAWWVNRKDSGGNNVFEGGFLGLDNIGVFDRSAPLPPGGYLEQADGTAWMALYCQNMLEIATELAMNDGSSTILSSVSLCRPRKV